LALSDNGFLVGGLEACQASVSRSKCASLYWLASFNASVDFPLAELPKISTLFIIFNLVIPQVINELVDIAQL
jgi:hypothetical protein